MLHGSLSGAISVLKGGHRFTPRAPRVGTRSFPVPRGSREGEGACRPTQLCPSPPCDCGESPDLSDPQLPPLQNGHHNASCQKGCGRAWKHLRRPKETPARCPECSLSRVAWARAERGQLVSVLSQQMATSWTDPSLV